MFAVESEVLLWISKRRHLLYFIVRKITTLSETADFCSIIAILRQRQNFMKISTKNIFEKLETFKKISDAFYKFTNSRTDDGKRRSAMY